MAIHSECWLLVYILNNSDGKTSLEFCGRAEFEIARCGVSTKRGAMNIQKWLSDDNSRIETICLDWIPETILSLCILLNNGALLCLEIDNSCSTYDGSAICNYSANFCGLKMKFDISSLYSEWCNDHHAKSSSMICTFSLYQDEMLGERKKLLLIASDKLLSLWELNTHEKVILNLCTCDISHFPPAHSISMYKGSHGGLVALVCCGLLVYSLDISFINDRTSYSMTYKYDWSFVSSVEDIKVTYDDKVILVAGMDIYLRDMNNQGLSCTLPRVHLSNITSIILIQQCSDNILSNVIIATSCISGDIHFWKIKENTSFHESEVSHIYTRTKSNVHYTNVGFCCDPLGDVFVALTGVPPIKGNSKALQTNYNLSHHSMMTEVFLPLLGGTHPQQSLLPHIDSYCSGASTQPVSLVAASALFHHCVQKVESAARLSSITPLQLDSEPCASSLSDGKRKNNQSIADVPATKATNTDIWNLENGMDSQFLLKQRVEAIHCYLDDAIMDSLRVASSHNTSDAMDLMHSVIFEQRSADDDSDMHRDKIVALTEIGRNLLIEIPHGSSSGVHKQFYLFVLFHYFNEQIVHG